MNTADTPCLRDHEANLPSTKPPPGSKEGYNPLLDKPPLPEDQIKEMHESLLCKAGLTLPLVGIVLASGLGLLSDSLQIMGISFAKGLIAQSFSLSRQEEGMLSGVHFAGMLVGGLFLGRLADIAGRRTVLVVSLLMNGFSTALCAVAHSFWFYLIVRFFSGLGVGGSLALIFSYAFEWSPAQVKCAVSSTINTCWTIGGILAALLAWAFLPQQNQPAGAFWQPWRSYLLLCSAPSLVSGAIYLFLDESPIFLAEAGRIQEALSILQKYCKRTPDSQEELVALKQLTEEVGKSRPRDSKDTLLKLVYKFVIGMVDLFRGRLRNTTLLLMAVILPVHFGYFGFMLWFPEYLAHQSASTGTVRSPEKIYRDSTYVYLSAMPSNLFCIFLSDRIGPKRILSGGLVLSAGSVFLLWRCKSSDMAVIGSCVFNGVVESVFFMVNFIIPALYPPQFRYVHSLKLVRLGLIWLRRNLSIIRNSVPGLLERSTSSRSHHPPDFSGTAFGFHTAMIRVVSILAIWCFSLFIDSSPTIPILLTAIILLLSGFLAIKLPSGPQANL